MKLLSTLIFILILLCSCGQKKQETVVTPWGEIADTIPTDDSFDLDEIQRNGELIALTLTGPETYYDYRGKHLGAQYLLAQKFADKLGVSLRMEVCRDSAEMLQRLEDGEADLICYPMTKKGLGWLVGDDKEDLEEELKAWYKPGMLAEVKKEEEFLLSNRAVRRRVFAPMLNRAGGVISHYDGFFQRYASTIRWDWRLLAAQCYQESTFDPKARSWAGACGLMQIMPGTADHLGLSRANIYDPYNDPVVKNGYMRGSETVDYVRKIHERWNGYRGVKTVRTISGPQGIPQKAKHERKKKYQIGE